MSIRQSKRARQSDETHGADVVAMTRDDEAERLLQFGAMGKAFSLLETIVSNSSSISMADLVRETGMTKPTAHRIISVLTELGFVERDHDKRGYVEGPRLIQFALSTLAAAAPRGIRHAILRALSEETGETCNFGILSGSEVIYLDRVEAKWPLGLRFESGSQVPAHCTAIGKLLLSQKPEGQLKDLLRTIPLSRFTDRTITDADTLAEALAAIRESGIGIDDQEFIQGVVCIAVPVTTAAGELVGGVAVMAPEARLTMDQALGFVPQMQQAAAQLGETFSLGAS